MKSNSKKNKSNFRKSLKGGDSSTLAISEANFSEMETVQAKPLEVIVYNNSFDKALRAFRALVQKERILSLYKEKQTYEKRSDKRRRKKNESKRKAMIAEIQSLKKQDESESY